MLNYMRPAVGQTEQLKSLYKVCFQEDDAAELYFDGFLTTDICYTAQENGNIAACLYLIPAQVADGNTTYKAHYLFAAATLPAYRSRGIMANLIDYALECAKEEGDLFSMLLPAEESLYGYYKRFGYQEAFQAKFSAMTHRQICALTQQKSKVTNCSFDNIAQLRFNILIGIKGSLLFGAKHIELACKAAAVYGGGVFTAKSGYILYFAQEKEMHIAECICENADFCALLAAFADRVRAERYILRLPAFMQAPGEIRRFGMVKPLFGALNTFYTACENAYLGLTLD